MISEINKNHILAYKELLEKVPHLRTKLESGKLFNNDINTIARSVLIKEMDNGSFCIEKKISEKDREKYTKTPHNQLALIRKICSVGKMQPREIQVLFNQKPEDKEASVDIVRRKNKRNASEKDVRETKKRKLEDPNHLHKELIDILAKAPAVIQKIMLDYTGPVPSHTKYILDLIRKGESLDTELDTTQLDLSEEPYIKIVREEFQKIVSTLKNLKSLTLPTNATEYWLEDVSKHCQHLESLGLGAQVFKNFNIPKNLKSLTIDGILFTSSCGLDISFLRNHKDLTDLNLYGCKLRYINVLEELPALKNLTIRESGTKNLCFIKNCKALENLTIFRCKFAHIIDAIGSLTSLKSLNLSYCTTLDISSLRYCKSLESLNLSGCTKIQNLADTINKCTSLKNLNFSSLFFMEIPTVKDLTVLESLDVSGCTYLNNIDIIRNFIALKSLKLSHCISLMDISAIEYCINLESLDLTGCTNIQNLAVIEKLPNLKNIKLP